MVELPPLQRIGVALTETTSAGGSVIVIEADVALQPLASVTVNVYVPAVRLNVPMPLYGGVPPVAATVTVEFPPLHNIGVADAVTAIAEAGCEMVIAAEVAEQPFASVTVKVYVPAILANVPVPVYGAVPPVAVTTTFDVPPKQRIGGAFTSTASAAEGCVMSTDADSLHPLASVTVKVCVPALRVNVPTPVYGGVPPEAVTVTVDVPP
jgi:hypothetical protein